MADGIPQGWKQVTDPNQLNQDMTERPVPGLYKATVPGIKSDNGRSNSLPVVTNSSNGNFQVYEQTIFGDKPIYSYNASNNKIIEVDKDKFKQYFSGAKGEAQLKNTNAQIKTSTLKIAEKGGGTEVEKKELEKLKKSDGYKSESNKSKTPDAAGAAAAAAKKKETSADQKEFEEENKEFKEGTRKEYANIKYPLGLQSEHQDCIKFSILEYRPSAQKKGTESVGLISRSIGATGGIAGAKILGSITLPIPAGISDTNSVSWQSDEINLLQKEGQSIATAFLSGGDATAEVKAAADKGQKGAPEIKTGLIGKFADLATSSSNAQQRAFGSIFNNNMELLFNGPSLRQFSFTFKLSPREPDEAKAIMKIIRFFKQAMSVKRSKSSILLKSPHSFAISYLTSNKLHPYLNKFKECALTSCGVDYSPENQYMTYMSSKIDERSMISYVISLSFQELEPVFEDKYGNEDPKAIQNVGY